VFKVLMGMVMRMMMGMTKIRMRMLTIVLAEERTREQ